jgi:hypothetical protein
VQGIGSALGAVLVDEPETDAGQQDRTDNHRVGALTEEERDQGGGREQDQHRAAELPSQDAQRLSMVAADRVRLDLGAPTSELLVGQAGR